MVSADWIPLPATGGDNGEMRMHVASNERLENMSRTRFVLIETLPIAIGGLIGLVLISLVAFGNRSFPTFLLVLLAIGSLAKAISANRAFDARME